MCSINVFYVRGLLGVPWLYGTVILHNDVWYKAQIYTSDLRTVLCELKLYI